MERGNTKHGPAHDDQLAHEPAEDPVEDSVPGSAGPDTRDRSELARVMTRDAFPVTRETLVRRLADSDAPAGLVERAENELTPGRRYEGVHEILDALGIASPETAERRTGGNG